MSETEKGTTVNAKSINAKAPSLHENFLTVNPINYPRL